MCLFYEKKDDARKIKQFNCKLTLNGKLDGFTMILQHQLETFLAILNLYKLKTIFPIQNIEYDKIGYYLVICKCP